VRKWSTHENSSVVIVPDVPRAHARPPFYLTANPCGGLAGHTAKVIAGDSFSFEARRGVSCEFVLRFNSS